MKRFILVCCALFAIVPALSWAQVSKDRAVMLEARIDSSTGKKNLIIRWDNFNAISKNVEREVFINQLYRRKKDNASWGAVKKLPLTSSEYLDATIEIGVPYEYRVDQSRRVINITRDSLDKITKRDTIVVSAVGYTESGIELPAVRDRGGIFILVDSIYSAVLAPELSRLAEDLFAEGWIVQRVDVPRRYTSVEVKDKIIPYYTADPTFWKALFVVGHVPVPYSGFRNPDGHPDHLGAWPTDLYYAEFDADWTDEINEGEIDIGGGKHIDTNTIRPANRNQAGDGKFDQSQIPDDIDLMSGRADFYDMPSFKKTEKELLKQYLNKDHNFRVGIMTAPARGLVDDNFGYMGTEAFASSGWRNLAPLVGIDSVKEIDFISTVAKQPYLWAYGTGGGYDQGAGGIGTTDDFSNPNNDPNKGSKAIFTMLFGSYFGDWNTQNNFLRAPLGTEYGLSCAWSGRPWWHFFPMGLGEPIGYCAQLSQNNTGSYEYNNKYGIVHWVHMEFLGDPTLRMNPIAPPTSLNITTSVIDNNAKLKWTASPDKNILGYYVYRAHTKNGPYTLITPQDRPDPAYTDLDPMSDSNYYFVHAVKLETTPSGSYYNLSPGINGVSFGLKSGVHDAAVNDANDLRVIQTSLSTQIAFTPSSTSYYTLDVIDAAGRTVKNIHSGTLSPGDYRYDWNNTATPSGLYFIRLSGGKAPETAKILIVK